MPHPPSNALLAPWLNSKHRDPSPIAEDARCKPYFRYAVLDHLFTPDALARVRGSLAAHPVGRTPVGPTAALAELLHDQAFVQWQHAALGLTFDPRSRVRAEVHRLPAGIATRPHVDDLPSTPCRIALFVYLGLRQADDGGWLELFQPGPELRLLDVIVPLDNRGVLLAMRPTPVVHAMSENRKERCALVSWIV